jgi:hypothetical protein
VLPSGYRHGTPGWAPQAGQPNPRIQAAVCSSSSRSASRISSCAAIASLTAPAGSHPVQQLVDQHEERRRQGTARQGAGVVFE